MIDYAVHGNVAEILFNLSPVNTFTHAFIDSLLESLGRAKADDEVRAVIIGGALPRRFCAGLDLGVLRGNSHAEAHDLVDKLYARLCDVQFALGKPSIAAINGELRGGESKGPWSNNIPRSSNG